MKKCAHRAIANSMSEPLTERACDLSSSFHKVLGTQPRNCREQRLELALTDGKSNDSDAHQSNGG